jgi:ribosomal protein S21
MAALVTDSLRIEVQRGEWIDGALRRLKKALEKAGRVRDLQRHAYATTRGQRRRKKRAAARRRSEN